MNYAHLFLVCFIACTFSFIVFGVAGFQVVKLITKRWVVKALPEIINGMVTGRVTPLDSEARAHLEELLSNVHHTPPGPFVVDVCSCGRRRAASVPPDWVFDRRLFGGWGCPVCAERLVSVTGDPDFVDFVSCKKHDEKFKPSIGETCGGCRREVGDAVKLDS